MREREDEGSGTDETRRMAPVTCLKAGGTRENHGFHANYGSERHQTYAIQYKQPDLMKVRINSTSLFRFGVVFIRRNWLWRAYDTQWVGLDAYHMHAKTAYHMHAKTAYYTHAKTAYHMHAKTAYHMHAKTAYHMHAKTAYHMHAKTAYYTHAKTAYHMHAKTAYHMHAKTAYHMHAKTAYYMHARNAYYMHAKVNFCVPIARFSVCIWRTIYTHFLDT